MTVTGTGTGVETGTATGTITRRRTSAETAEEHKIGTGTRTGTGSRTERRGNTWRLSNDAVTKGEPVPETGRRKRRREQERGRARGWVGGWREERNRNPPSCTSVVGTKCAREAVTPTGNRLPQPTARSNAPARTSYHAMGRSPWTGSEG